MPGPAPGYRDHPDHKVVITPHNKRVRVKFGGRVVAESERPLAVLETGRRPVYYLPRDDVDLAASLVPTRHATHCPFKGEARYWTVAVGDRRSENAAWAYDDPYDEARGLAKYVAFYPDRVDAIEEEPITTRTDPKFDGGTHTGDIRNAP